MEDRDTASAMVGLASIWLGHGRYEEALNLPAEVCKEDGAG